jgi:hypothetical protein
MKLSKWIEDGDCSMRVIHGSDPSKVENRFAFISKTPRVKLTKHECAEEKIENNVSSCSAADNNFWVFGWKGCGEEMGRYKPSRDWCDAMLKLMGYELED